jgi:hypothetical protein
MADSLAIDYDLPLASITPGQSAGHVQLRIFCGLGSMSVADQEFLLSVIDKVNEFSALVAPRPREVELPAVLRGVGGRP